MKKILIVEDVEMNMELLIQLLEDDYELIMATDGQAGVERAQEDAPDLVLMDMSLPLIDGWEATRRIKSSDKSRHIPVIGLSAHAMQGDREKAIEAGCDDYLTKPLDDMLLLEKLQGFLA